MSKVCIDKLSDLTECKDEEEMKKWMSANAIDPKRLALVKASHCKGIPEAELAKKRASEQAAAENQPIAAAAQKEKEAADMAQTANADLKKHFVSIFRLFANKKDAEPKSLEGLIEAFFRMFGADAEEFQNDKVSHTRSIRWKLETRLIVSTSLRSGRLSPGVNQPSRF